ncbi:GH32 C-terminal domain-containing protein [Halomicrobium sp. LC1Hm]|uniref:GH32 C-terminal domain-containing protein n=1 Tax=Halomicrobium sp. LC1Hm TaxID=2610902 RepID=UPI0012983C01|nr:GH32 C-terminal domain-containing protein [Halomicrobium sp. LC1Hm]
MTDTAVRVASLHDGGRSVEQIAADEWAERAGLDLTPVAVSDLVDGDRSLAAFDTCWWHADEPPELGSAADLGGVLRAFVRSGGGLVLSLAALTAVSDLGIDPVAPDAVGPDPDGGPTGPLIKAAYDDHPLFESLATRRPLTRGGTDATLARYDSILPERGEVLASTVSGDHDVPDLVTVVGWSLGDGSVVGLGDGLVFAAEGGDHDQRDRLARAVLTNAADSAIPERPRTGDEIAALRDRFEDDPHRPQFHLSTPANWLNDPNGVVQWNGRYHVFYQYNPGGPYHDTIHWGHAVSDDLLHWEDEPVALTPSPDGPDRDGCWSGCAVDDDGTATLVYTGGRGRDQLPCLATTDDPSLRRWEKVTDNPIIEAPPTEPDLLSTEEWNGEFRDHCVWQDGGTWYQLIGAGLADGGGVVLLYESPDLREWEYCGPILSGDRDTPQETVWECPELLDLGEKQLLHVSNYEDVIYFLGRFDGTTFELERRGTLDHGDYYAPQSLRADDGRLLTWGWVPEARDVSAQWDAGWSGTMSLPRELSLGDDGRLRQRPARELTRLRGDRESRESVTLDDGESIRLDTDGRAFELATRLSLVDADAVEVTLLGTAAENERTTLRYTRDDVLEVDRSRASTDPRATSDSQHVPVTPYDEPLDLRVFVDGSVVELFANERHCLTSRVYPTGDDATGVGLAAVGGRARLPTVDAWDLASIW